jgi:uncharacterized membrane protein
MTGVLYAATLATALGCGLVAGVFFAFSTFVMPALGALPAAQGIAAMQSINRAVITPSFMAAFVGTGVACLALIVWAVLSAGDSAAAWVLGGGSVYLAGVIGITRARNIPMNDALDRLDPRDPDAARMWTRYVARWTAWNHLRTLASLAAAALFTVALVG